MLIGHVVLFSYCHLYRYQKKSNYIVASVLTYWWNMTGNISWPSDVSDDTCYLSDRAKILFNSPAGHQ